MMKRFLKILAIIIAVLALTFILLPGYVQKALIFWGPSIDDYKIFNNRVVNAGKAQPWKIHPEYNTYRLTEDDRKTIESYNPVAFLVIKDTSIIYEEYWDGYDTASLSNSFSVAKSIVSLLIGIAIDEGKIDSVNQKACDFIPEYKEGTRKNLTIEQLLTMSSGLNWEEAYKSPFSPTTKAYYGDDITSQVLDLEVVETPGKVFDYLSGNTQVLAMVLEAATGVTLSDYASEKIWKKIGAEKDALWNLDSEDGVEKAYCCFNSNARDFARLGQLILNNGSWNNEQIVSKTYLNEATSSKDYLVNRKDKAMDYYGYQFWIMDYQGQKIPYMRGILGQYIIPIPEENAVIVRLGHDRSKSYINHHPQDAVEYVEIGTKILKNKY